MGAFSEELSAFRVLLDGLEVELKVVVDVGFLGLNFQIGRHGWLAHIESEREIGRYRGKEESRERGKEKKSGEE